MDMPGLGHLSVGRIPDATVRTPRPRLSVPPAPNTNNDAQDGGALPGTDLGRTVFMQTEDAGSAAQGDVKIAEDDPRLRLVIGALSRPRVFAGMQQAFLSRDAELRWQARAVLTALDEAGR